MKQRLVLFAQTGLFWLVFFIVSRLLFLGYNHDLTATLSFTDVLTLMALGLRMDAAMAGYWLLLTGLLLTLSCLLAGRWVGKVHGIITVSLLLISAVIVVGDLELYRNWGFRMDATPLMYLGSEGAASVQPWALVQLVLLFGLLVASFVAFYYFYLREKYFNITTTAFKKAPVLFLFTGLLFIPIRSSFNVAPLNTGVVYFHKTNAFANHAGINVVWNFFKGLSSSNRFRYPENIMQHNDAEERLQAAMAARVPSQRMLRHEKPNILLIVLESYTAKVIEPLGGRPGITPRLNTLTHEGILFDDFYASGDRTDKGIVSILSGYPAQPKTSIIKFPKKTQSLPSLPRHLEKLGYATSFVYGGDIGFANMESYVTNMGFSHVTEEGDFPALHDNSKWGVHDHLVFDRLLNECDSARSPFFKVMLSLSSHEPFDVPLDPPFTTDKDDASLFLNACYYTDQSLGRFLDEAKKRDWWQNTWVIITADHGHRFPDTEELREKSRFKIPMLWLGGALNTRDTVVHSFGNQTDIANTVLAQIDQPVADFAFSKDLLAQPMPFAIYIFHNGYGYIDPDTEFIYDFDLGNYTQPVASQEKEMLGRAYMQRLFKDYNRR